MSSIEFQLTVECCRRSFADGAPDKIHELCQAVDWNRLLRMIRLHRVQGLAWNGLSSVDAEVPSDIAPALLDDARAIAGANLRAAAEARELRAEAARAGIPMLFVKGLTVAALAYPNPMLKMSSDMDVLVRESDLEKAAAALRMRGFRLSVPADPADLSRWHASWKESIWCLPEQGLYLELHTRLADNRRSIAGIGIDSPQSEVHVTRGISLPTLADDELFAYLAVHGASSAWFRLKWIVDFAALLHGRWAHEIDRLYERSQELGAGRAAGQALLLADHLFAVLDPVSSLRATLQRDRAASCLYRAALKLLTSEAGELTERRWGTLPIHWTQFLLQPGFAYKLSELARQLKGMPAQSAR